MVDGLGEETACGDIPIAGVVCYSDRGLNTG